MSRRGFCHPKDDPPTFDESSRSATTPLVFSALLDHFPGSVLAALASLSKGCHELAQPALWKSPIKHVVNATMDGALRPCRKQF